MPSDIVIFERVSLSYGEGKNVFQDISFRLFPGSFHYLTGASGAGKSSLIKLLCISIRDYRGAISVFGRDLRNVQKNNVAAYRSRLGVVFQDFLLLDHLSVLENVILPLKLRGVRDIKARATGLELLTWIGLKGLEDSLPETLSGGEKQRLAIARAVIHFPRLLIADEPTGNVDNENAVKLIHYFKSLLNKGITVIFATHNHDLVAEFPYPCLHLEDGKLHLIPSYTERKKVIHA